MVASICLLFYMLIVELITIPVGSFWVYIINANRNNEISYKFRNKTDFIPGYVLYNKLRWYNFVLLHFLIVYVLHTNLNHNPFCW